MTAFKRRAALANLSFGSVNVGLTLVAGLLLVPWYLRHFDLATYGAWLASGSVVSAIAVFESGLSSVLTRRLAGANASGETLAFARLASSGLALAFAIGVLVMAIGLAVSPFVPAWVHAPADQYDNLRRAMQIASVAAGASVVFINLGAIPQAWQQTVAPGIIGTMAFLANVVVILVLLRLGAGVVALAGGRLALALTYVIGYVVYILRHWRLKGLVLHAPVPATSLEIWRESRSLLAAQIANTVSSNMEAFVAAALVSPQAAAVVSLTGKLVSTVRMFLEHVGSAAFAGVTIAKQRLTPDGFRRLLQEFLTIATSLSGIGVGCALAISPSLIPKWVGGAAYGGTVLLLLIALSDVLGFRKGIMAWLLLAGAQTKSVARIAVLEAILRPVALVAAVAALGIHGVPLAGAVASAIPLALLMKSAADTFDVAVGAQLRAGLRSFLTGAALGLGWLLLVPPTESWFWLAMQLGGVAALTLGATLAADVHWRTAVRHNLRMLTGQRPVVS